MPHVSHVITLRRRTAYEGLLNYTSLQCIRFRLLALNLVHVMCKYSTITNYLNSSYYGLKLESELIFGT